MLCSRRVKAPLLNRGGIGTSLEEGVDRDPAAWSARRQTFLSERTHIQRQGQSERKQGGTAIGAPKSAMRCSLQAVLHCPRRASRVLCQDSVPSRVLRDHRLECHTLEEVERSDLLDEIGLGGALGQKHAGEAEGVDRESVFCRAIGLSAFFYRLGERSSLVPARDEHHPILGQEEIVRKERQAKVADVGFGTRCKLAQVVNHEVKQTQEGATEVDAELIVRAGLEVKAKVGVGQRQLERRRCSLVFSPRYATACSSGVPRFSGLLASKHASMGARPFGSGRNCKLYWPVSTHQVCEAHKPYCLCGCLQGDVSPGTRRKRRWPYDAPLDEPQLKNARCLCSNEGISDRKQRGMSCVPPWRTAA